VPTEAQEQLRMASRQHDQLVEERKRLGAQGNAMLLSQGFGSWSNWWRPKAWAVLSSKLPPWLLERLEVSVDVLKVLDEKIAQAKAAFARSCKGPRPKGVGAVSQMQLQSEVLDWSLYSNRRKIACLAGMVPSEWSTGDKEWRGSITKVGVPALRRIIVEMVWRIIFFQPQYKPVQKSRHCYRSTTDSGSVAAPNWKGHRPGTQSDYGHRLRSLKCGALRRGADITRGSAPNPVFGGNSSISPFQNGQSCRRTP
jgi:transposase